jgi:hypothetical protein
VKAGRPQPARPAPEEDFQHPAGTEELWSESWYFDAVSADGTLGVYARIGRLPNQEIAIYTAAVVRPGKPAILIVDQAAPLPTDERQTIVTETFRSQQECVVPMEEFRVTLEGVGEAHADHSAPLRDEGGAPIEVAFDLTWTTDGIPYAWRNTPRYELPCHVTGTVRIGTTILAFDGPGQRDHSCGPRDWWAFDWMWSAFHLDDRTRIHAVALSHVPGLLVGYVQRGDEIAELSAGSSTRTVAATGLATSATINIDDTGLAPMPFS